ncbi:hypothetical protein ACH434_23775 [Lysinibacillus fusiformis]|uniref:hypothetical protein n=1 Tax=Lysinibacillus fusiformis TaxID=28031 RepID=UPI0037AEB519
MNKLFKPNLEGQDYGQYMVAFIDILGFRNIVQKSENEIEYFKKILHATQIIEHLVGYNDEKQKNKERFVEMVQFSDSLVISMPYNGIYTLRKIIMDLDLVQKIIARDVGIMLRGGLTYGKLYHKGNISFGPAFVDAYQLESKVAKTPRIIIDPKLLEPSGDDVNQCMLHSIIQSTLKKDVDGYYFINFLGGDFAGPTAPEVAEKLKKYAELELSNITEVNEQNESIKAKMIWMLDYIKECGY